MHKFKILLKLFRIHHWIKNTLIFAPLVFSDNLFNFTLLTKSVTAFVLFCLLSSGVYIINDIFDLEEDRKHQQKRNRPIASGSISVKSAVAIAVFLFLLSLIGSYVLERTFFFIALAYLVIEIAYTLKLKEIVIIDALCVAAGFVLRVASGTAVTMVPLSNWLFISVGSLALFLAFAKRRGELLHMDKEAASHRQVLSHYNPYYLDQMMMITAASTLAVYTMYALDTRTVVRLGEIFAVTVIFVFYGIFRYQFLIYHKADSLEDPMEHLIFDKPLLATCLLWLLSVALIIYF